MQLSVDDCKSKLRNLRSYYRRALQRRKTVSGQAATNMIKWRYEDQMAFLKPHIQERETVSNLSPHEDVTESLSVEVGDETDYVGTPDVSPATTSLSPAPASTPASAQAPVTARPPVSARLPTNKLKTLPTTHLSQALTNFIAERKTTKEETPEMLKKRKLMTFFEDISESMMRFSELD
ncbi:uncharacterized protein LOC111055536 [Nilaparvata lugens]|uniref:uncharacterized protein LOC111055536 n=1 Tax=Nilaparvata lugens TaxID=108931 RepID=UPI00193E6533|nr:uncharacterized protein LOC111055536 [Nilaparvata lugens]